MSMHPVHQINDGVFDSASGLKISIHNPTVEMICLDDIALALSNICRFGGQSKHFYSVAQHSLLVAKLAPMELRKAAILHDAAEAYLGDVISPLKKLLPEYKVIEERFERIIFIKYGVLMQDFAKIKEFDMRACEMEHAYLRGTGKGYEFVEFMDKHFGITVKEHGYCWDNKVSHSYFIAAAGAYIKH